MTPGSQNSQTLQRLDHEKHLYPLKQLEECWKDRSSWYIRAKQATIFFTDDQQKELTALDRQGTQQQSRELHAVTVT